MTIQEVQLHNRFTGAMRQYAHHLSSKLATIMSSRTASSHGNGSARGAMRRILNTAHHALLVSGIAALTTLTVLFFRPDLARHLRTVTPFGNSETPHQVVEVSAAAAPTDMPKPVKGTRSEVPRTDLALADDPQVNAFRVGHEFSSMKTAATERQQRWVTNWLSKRYRVANDATDMLVSAAYVTATDIKIDPLLILAVVAIESGFNPFAESAVGAQGLMQVMSKVHQEKFQTMGGVKAALNPVANIRVGSGILKEYVARGGSVEAGLKMYVGAAAFDNDAGYGSKVLAEYRRLKDVASGKNVPLFFQSPVVAAHVQPKASDSISNLPKDEPVIDDKALPPEATNPAPEPADRLAAM